MNPGRFYMPRMGVNMGPMMGTNYLPIRGTGGLFGRIANSLKTFNWSGLLNGANKTLNVVNQTIPLVRQAGPMLNNMKSMFRIAKAFGSETNTRTNRNNSNNALEANNSVVTDVVTTSANTNTTKSQIVDDSYPNFFV